MQPVDCLLALSAALLSQVPSAHPTEPSLRAWGRALRPAPDLNGDGIDEFTFLSVAELAEDSVKEARYRVASGATARTLWRDRSGMLGFDLGGGLVFGNGDAGESLVALLGVNNVDGGRAVRVSTDVDLEYMVNAPAHKDLAIDITRQPSPGTFQAAVGFSGASPYLYLMSLDPRRSSGTLSMLDIERGRWTALAGPSRFGENHSFFALLPGNSLHACSEQGSAPPVVVGYLQESIPGSYAVAFAEYAFGSSAPRGAVEIAISSGVVPASAARLDVDGRRLVAIGCPRARTGPASEQSPDHIKAAGEVVLVDLSDGEVIQRVMDAELAASWREGGQDAEFGAAVGLFQVGQRIGVVVGVPGFAAQPSVRAYWADTGHLIWSFEECGLSRGSMFEQLGRDLIVLNSSAEPRVVMRGFCRDEAASLICIGAVSGKEIWTVSAPSAELEQYEASGADER